MKQIYGRLLVIDGSHTLHRSICEPHLWDMKNINNQRTGGVFGTLQSILKESSIYNYFPVVVFDGHLSQRRLNIYSNYKRNEDKQLLVEHVETLTDIEQLQQEQRYEYNRQREILKILLPAFGIPTIHLSDWEGDDIIYILSQITRDSIILSDDKDMLQLVCETPDRMCRVKRGMRDIFVDKQWLETNNMTVEEFICTKAIIGDASDNIPSACFQVGEKTAPNLYKLYLESKKLIGRFPTDEKELDKICKEIGISKRKAYLNFDENQFLTNLLLMDLSLVANEITPELIQELDNIIQEQACNIDVKVISDILDELEIKTFIPNNLINNVLKSKPCIYSIPDNLQPIVPKNNCPKLF